VRFSDDQTGFSERFTRNVVSYYGKIYIDD